MEKAGIIKPGVRGGGGAILRAMCLRGVRGHLRREPDRRCGDMVPVVPEMDGGVTVARGVRHLMAVMCVWRGLAASFSFKECGDGAGQ